MLTARLFIGGPCDGEMRVVDESSLSVSCPVERRHRTDPDVPEWQAYRLEGDDMVFAGRGVNAFDVLWGARNRGGTQ